MRISDWSSDVCSSDLDADADRPIARLPHLETGVAGPEIEFLLIARTVGNMGLPIDAHHLALVVDHGEAVVMMRAVRLEEAGGDVDLQLRRELLHRKHGGMQIGRAHV